MTASLSRKARGNSLEDKEPNGAHRALVELERRGHLDAVVTQNIDRLHRRAGSQELVEVHGTIDHASCLECGEQHTLTEVQVRIAAADDLRFEYRDPANAQPSGRAP